MTIDREPTANEAMGMAWWNSLTDSARTSWMAKAGNTGVVADAWAVFRAEYAPLPGPALQGEERQVLAALAEAARLVHDARLRAERCGWGSILADFDQVEAGLRSILRDVG